MKTASPAEPAGHPLALRHPKGEAGLWLWVAAGFLLLALAWAVLFTVARATKVESVPLAPQEARP